MHFVTESVSEGHPDKLCDLISDKILDAYLAQDKHAKVACECLISAKKLIIAGEVSAHADVNLRDCVHQVFKDVGLFKEPFADFYKQLEIENLLVAQSSEINEKVTHAHSNKPHIGAGDQGIVIGYACKQTPVYLPLISLLANEMMAAASILRKQKKLPFALADMKCQIVAKYDSNKILSDPANAFTIVSITFAIQHKPSLVMGLLNDAVYQLVVMPLIKKYCLNDNFEFSINSSGPFLKGGAIADTGLTGRKLNVDSYGGWVPVGGGAFSGKDATKIDRSAAYAARYIAKNLVASGYCDTATVLLSYLIGYNVPVAININTHNTNHYPLEQIYDLVHKHAPMSLSDIISRFKLLRPIYYKTAAYGHFFNQTCPWEKISMFLK